MLTNEKISLPKLILLHLQHARATEHHGIPYGGLIRRILEYLGAYIEGINVTTLGKPLDIRCLKLAFFSYYEGNWIKVDKPRTTTEEEEVSKALLQLEGAPSSADMQYKHYIHPVTLLGDL